MSLEIAVAELQKKLNRKDTFEDAVKRLTWIVRGGEYKNATCQQQQAVRPDAFRVQTRGKYFQHTFRPLANSCAAEALHTCASMAHGASATLVAHLKYFS